jgi:hypothetical protein
MPNVMKSLLGISVAAMVLAAPSIAPAADLEVTH